ncbi:hypothetical protein BL253_31935 [Pseudofrankia asymbiotica]|uniref:Uncharacterized protein n=2 Tax=Pseudofrankia asymbiotica TaxID=1834516 RepID=A0A1V2I1M8_9ACTN|nr:hypothetical protein BL253_31935 [Pseudofrankia asymbiotica]
MTAREIQLAEALVQVIDYTGRVLLVGMSDSPHYLWDKSSDLADAAARVAELLDAADGHAGRDTGIRLRPVAKAVRHWAKSYPAGVALFGGRGRR